MLHHIPEINICLTLWMTTKICFFPFPLQRRTKHTLPFRLDNWKLRKKQEKKSRSTLWIMVQNWSQDRLKDTGMQQHFSAPYTSAHIGCVECMHHTLMGKARTMHLYARCPKNLWDEFYLTATHLHIKVWTRNLNDQTPYELWKGQKLDYLYMHEIGCWAFILI